MKQLIQFSVLIAVIIACGKSPKSAEESNEIDSVTVHATDKEEVKAFWDAYRGAQKMRIEGKWAEAIAGYQKAIAIDSLHQDSWFNMGNMYLELHQYKEAERCWKKVVYFNDNSAKAHMQLGRLYMSFDRPEVFDASKARTELLKSASINIMITGPQMQLGHLSLIEGKFEEARSLYEKVIGSDTRNIEAHFLLAYLEHKAGNDAKAAQLFKKAIENSSPEKAMKDVPNEGDTKDGVVMVRPISLSFFIHYFNDLYLLDKENFQGEMEDRFARMDTRLAEIQRVVKGS